VQLQRAVTALVDWAREWQLAISIEKCCVLNIGQCRVTPHVTIMHTASDVRTSDM